MLSRGGSLQASLFLQFFLFCNLFLDLLWGFLGARRLQGQRLRRRHLHHFSFFPFGRRQLFLTLAATLSSALSLRCIFIFLSAAPSSSCSPSCAFKALLDLKMARVALVDGLLVCTVLQQLVVLVIIGTHFHHASEESSERTWAIDHSLLF